MRNVAIENHELEPKLGLEDQRFVQELLRELERNCDSAGIVLHHGRAYIFAATILYDFSGDQEAKTIERLAFHRSPMAASWQGERLVISQSKITSLARFNATHLCLTFQLGEEVRTEIVEANDQLLTAFSVLFPTK
jgi:hypothetical protein